MNKSEIIWLKRVFCL